MAIPSTAKAKYAEVLQSIIDHHNTKLEGTDTIEWAAHLSKLTEQAAAYGTMLQYDGILAELNQ